MKNNKKEGIIKKLDRKCHWYIDSFGWVILIISVLISMFIGIVISDFVFYFVPSTLITIILKTINSVIFSIIILYKFIPEVLINFKQ